jgi:putative membrane protein
MQLIVIVGMLIAACGVVFALQNNVPVTLTFLLWRLDGSLAMVLLGALVMGGLIVALVSTPSTLRRQWTIARQSRRIAELEKAASGTSEVTADPQRHPQGNSGTPG